MIDAKTVTFYTCCKCGHEWTNWDGKNKREGPIPRNCPKCRNIRWNKEYTKQELDLIKKIQDKHYIWKGEDPIMDFIAFDFLHNMTPPPELLELKQVAAIESLEDRHELMISIIRQRLYNISEYGKKGLPGHTKYHYYGGAKRWPVKEEVCKHRYLMDIFEQISMN